MSSTINPSLFSGQYYQIPSASGSSDSNTGSATTNSQGTSIDALLQALSSSSSSSSGDTVDLSPEAQSYLNSLNGGSSGSTPSSIANMMQSSSVSDISALLGSIGGTGSDTSSISGTGQSGGNGFILTPQQQQQLTAILQKYQNAPFTQDTFNQIQNDLKAAGLSPDQLSLEDQLRNFNPTTMLLDALNGVTNSSDMINFGNDPTEQANANTYIQQVYSQWQHISTTAGNSDNSAASGSGSVTPAGSA